MERPGEMQYRKDMNQPGVQKQERLQEDSLKHTVILRSVNNYA